MRPGAFSWIFCLSISTGRRDETCVFAMFADTVMPSSISDLTESDGEAGFESIAATKSADEYNINTMQTSFIRTIPSVP